MSSKEKTRTDSNEGTLRHPSYLGLREDKRSEAVVLETEAPVGEATAPATLVKISNRERIIDPDAGITKGQLADHYAAVSPARALLGQRRSDLTIHTFVEAK